MSKRQLAAAVSDVGLTTFDQQRVDEVTAAVGISDSRPLNSAYRTGEIWQLAWTSDDLPTFSKPCYSIRNEASEQCGANSNSPSAADGAASGR